MIKHSFFLIICYLVVSKFCHAQENDIVKSQKYELAQTKDTYVAKIKAYDKLITKRCKCLNIKKSSLFRLEIIEVYYVPDSTVYNISELFDTKFIVVEDKMKIKENEEYFITLSPGMNRGYLIFNRVLDIEDPKSFQFYHKNPYLSGFTECYKLGVWDRLLLFLRLKKMDEVDYSSKKKRKDPFYKFILSSDELCQEINDGTK